MNERRGPVRTAILHDELVAALRDVAARLEPSSIARAFVSALRSRRYEHWSSLASYALARTLPAHAFESVPNGAACRLCGAYLRVDAFESDEFASVRHAGMVRSDSLRYALYDLEAFERESFAEPSQADRDFFDLALARIGAIAADETIFAAERALGVVFDSRTERKRFLGVLGICGILPVPERPGFWPSFVPFEKRASLDATPYTYPVTWWRRKHGIHVGALHAFELASRPR